jgi:hypothetical protein
MMKRHNVEDSMLSLIQDRLLTEKLKHVLGHYMFFDSSFKN